MNGIEFLISGSFNNYQSYILLFLLQLSGTILQVFMGNDIFYKELEPCADLRDFIKTYWYYENNTTGDVDYTILPDACFDILIYFLGDRFEKVSITGLWTEPVDVTMKSTIKVFAIRLKPLAAEYILNMSISNAKNSSFDGLTFLDNLGVKIDSISELKDLKSVADDRMIDIISSSDIGIRKEKLFKCIEEHRGNISVSELSRTVGLSSRQINRYFNTWFGLSLKQYCSINMIKQCYPKLSNKEFFPPEGYYDQSHYIRNIKKFTGVTPGEIISDTKGRFFQVETEQK